MNATFCMFVHEYHGKLPTSGPYKLGGNCIQNVHY